MSNITVFPPSKPANPNPKPSPKTNLMQASHQWATRPPDECYWSLRDAHARAAWDKQEGWEWEFPISSLACVLGGRTGMTLSALDPTSKMPTPQIPLSYLATSQLAKLTGYPMSAIERLSKMRSQGGVKLAQDSINLCLLDEAVARAENKLARMEALARGDAGLRNRTSSDPSIVKILGAPKWEYYRESHGQAMENQKDPANHEVRAITSQGYTRFWDADIIERCIWLEEELGWRVPPARPSDSNPEWEELGLIRKATEQDVLKIGAGGGAKVQVGEMIRAAGIYRGQSTPSLFIIMTQDGDEHRVEGVQGGLSKGVIITHSELGDASLKFLFFLHAGICGNHIIWDAQDMMEVSVRHLGSVDRFREAVEVKLAEYGDKAVDETRIAKAKSMLLGGSKEEVLDLLFGKRVAPKKALEAAYTAAEQHEQWYLAPPSSAWGMAQGLSEISQREEFSGGYQDKRHELDMAAGKVLRMVR